jgi:ABC-type glutathione transport system ATPase component
MNDDLLLSVGDLNVKFGHQLILENLNLDIKVGEKILITGPSGCGKSTILNVLLGAISPINVTSSRLQLSGREYFDYREYRKCSALPNQLGIVFQDAMHSLNPYRSIQKQFKNYLPTEVMGALRGINIDPGRFLNVQDPVFPRNCSGGELQRLSLVHSILLSKNLILLDEPLTDIDLISRKMVVEALRPILEDPNLAVLLVSHDVSWVPTHFKHLELSERKLVLAANDGMAEQGRLHADVHKARTERFETLSANRTKKELFFKLEIKKPLKISPSFTLLPPSNLSIIEGQRIGVLGESGSGKSTFMRLAAGLQAVSTELGSVKVIGSSGKFSGVDTMNRKERSGRIQIVFQDTTGSAFGNRLLIHAFKDAAKVRRTSLNKICKTLDQFSKRIGLVTRTGNLDEIFNRKFEEFSIGQRRRIALLTAIAHLDIYNKEETKSPKLLLLDEPSRGLDKQTKVEVTEALLEFCEDYNIAVIAISHDLKFLQALCTSFRFVFNGAILPSVLHRDDLDRARNKKDLSGVNNPYYVDFLNQREPKKKTLVVHKGEVPGCILERVAICSYKSENQCQYHDALCSAGEIGICA